MSGGIERFAGAKEIFAIGVPHTERGKDHYGIAFVFIECAIGAVGKPDVMQAVSRLQ